MSSDDVRIGKRLAESQKVSERLGKSPKTKVTVMYLKPFKSRSIRNESNLIQNESNLSQIWVKLQSNLSQNESNWSQIWIKMCEFGVKSVKIQIRCPIMHQFSYKILYTLKELLSVTVDLGWLFGECWKDLWFMSDCLLIRRSVEQNCCWHLQF